MDNPHEMEKFLDTQNLPRPNYKKLENLNGTITSKRVELVNKISQQIKTLDLMASLVNSAKHLEKLNPVLLPM